MDAFESLGSSFCGCAFSKSSMLPDEEGSKDAGSGRRSVVPRGSVAGLIAPIMNPDHKVHHLLKRVTAGYPGLLWALDGVSNRVLTREEVRV